ncbi:hypothetical protein FM112_07405 [Gulosibacter sp. 10]|nr:hypothetical protein FM112_07405 [Gulosibacter sp. 10]
MIGQQERSLQRHHRGEHWPCGEAELLHQRVSERERPYVRGQEKPGQRHARDASGCHGGDGDIA